MSEFYKTNGDGKEIVLAKFDTERNVIENLDLQAFPVSIKYSDVPPVQMSILKVTHLCLRYILEFCIGAIKISPLFRSL